MTIAMCLGLGMPAAADQNFENPLSRIMRKNVGNPNYLHWPNGIFVVALGDASPGTKIAALSEISFLGSVSGTNSTLLNFENVPESGISSNYFFVFDQVRETLDLSTVEQLIAKEIGEPLPISATVKAAFDANFVEIGPNCRAIFKIDDNNEVQAFVGLIGGSQDDPLRQGCVSSLISFSLGVHPAALEKEYISGMQLDVINFVDTSPRFLTLSAIGACRRQANEFNVQCPIAIVEDRLIENSNSLQRK